MKHIVRFVAVVAVLVALAATACGPSEIDAQDARAELAQTSEIDALRARAEAGDAEAQFNLGLMYGTGDGVQQDDVEMVRWLRLAAD